MPREDPVRRAPAWAVIAALGPAPWSVDRPPEVAPLPDIPLAGAGYWIRIEAAKLPPAGGPFWIFFQPPDSLFNGWWDCPHELGRSALVQLVVTGPGDEWQAVRVIDRLAIRDLPARFPPDPSGVVPEIPNRLRTRVDWEDLTFFDGNVEGDVGGWLVCQRTAGGHRLLVYGEWDRDGEFVYAGHRPLAAEEFSRLERAVQK